MQGNTNTDRGGTESRDRSGIRYAKPQFTQYTSSSGVTSTRPTKARRLAVGLLTTVEDFAAMRIHPSFEFTDYQHYLAEHARLLENLRAHGRPVRIGCFDPCEFLQYCTTAGIDPDSARNRARYVQDVCTSDPQTPRYTGQSIGEIIAELESDRRHQALLRILFDLLEDSVRQEEHPLRVMLQAEGHAASAFASIVNMAGQGRHQVVLRTVGESVQRAEVTLDFTIDGEALKLSKRRVIDALLTLYALCYVRRVPATITLLSSRGGDPDPAAPIRPVHTWRLVDQHVLPDIAQPGGGPASPRHALYEAIDR
ncbi:MAG TPA: hypothetical protein VGX23_22080 [Actinocrinis sp.]|nr:hypothetical protein [Actinocrinis sp.]